MKPLPAYQQSVVRLACTRCGAEAQASCNCGAPYEALLGKKEQDRQRARAYRERKREQEQNPHHVTPLAPESNIRFYGDLAFSSENDEWETPQDLFDQLNREFGFGLDVCATAANAKCKRYFSRENDGLAQQWTGACWMNPPYGEGIGQWTAKAALSHNATVVALLPARTDTVWWWDHCRHTEIRFLRGRLRFGGSPNSAPFPSAIVIFGRPASVVWWER